MAAETELERMLIRIVGDGSQYVNELNRTTKATERAGEHISKHGGRKPAAEMHKLHLGMRESRHAIHLLGAATGLEGISRPAMMGVHAFHLLSHSIGAATASLGLMGTAFAATGIGAAVIGVAGLVHMWHKLHEEQKAAAEGATKAFHAMTKGETSAAGALAEVDVEELGKDFDKLVQKWEAPGLFWDPFSKGLDVIGTKLRHPTLSRNEILGAAFRADMQKSIDKIFAAQQMLEKLKSPKYAPIALALGQAELTKETEKATEQVKMQVDTFDMGEAEAKKYAEILKLMKTTGMGGREAMETVDEQMKGYEIHTETLRRQKAAQDAANMRAETRTLGLKGTELNIQKKVNEYVKQHKGMTEDQARDELEQTGVLAAIRDKDAETLANQYADKAAAMNDETALIGMRGVSADILKEQLKLMREQGLSLDEAVAATEDLREAMEEAAAVKITENLQDDIRKTGVEMSKIGQSDWNKAVIDKTEEIRNKFGEAALASKSFQIQLDTLRDVKMGEAAAQLFEKVKTPIEKYSDKIGELNQLQKAGKISQDTYNRSIQMYRKEIFGATDQLTKFDAAQSGSADALSRIQEQYDKLHDNPLDFATTGVKGEGGTTGVTFSASPVGRADAASAVEESNTILKNINEAIQAIRQKGSMGSNEMRMRAAGIGGTY
jgi:hypothetical protein